MFEGNIYSIRKKNKGSSVKCVDTSRIDLTEKTNLPIKQKYSQDCKTTYFTIILRHRKPFCHNLLKM